MTTLAPWLSVRNGTEAVAFYREAFGAEIEYQVGDSDSIGVARLSIGGAVYWLSESTTVSPSDPSVRMILTVADPDAVFARAVTACATVVYPVADAHGWRVGRLIDPFGHHWEIGKPLS